MGIIVLAAVWMGWIAWAVNIARKRGRNATTWGVLALVLGVFAVLILYILPTRNAHA